MARASFYAYTPSAGGPEFMVSSALVDEKDFTGVVALTGLAPATEYEYRVLLDGAQAFAGIFSTLPKAGEPGRIRFAYAADVSHTPKPFVAFDALVAQKPDF